MSALVARAVEQLRRWQLLPRCAVGTCRARAVVRYDAEPPVCVAHALAAMPVVCGVSGCPERGWHRDADGASWCAGHLDTGPAIVWLDTHRLPHQVASP